MKIAIFINSLQGGGSERFASVLANGLANRKHQIYLITGPKREKEFNITSNIRRDVLYQKKSLLVDSISLHKYLIYNNIDICVAVGIYPNLVSALSNFCLKTKIIISERNAPKQDNLSWKSRLLRKLLYGRGDAFVFQTPDARDFYCSRIRERGVVIPNPLKEGLPMRKANVAKEIIAIGRLQKQKNYSMLLEAFSLIVANHPDYKLRIFGEGELETELREQSKKLHINKNVSFEGFSDDVHRKICNSDIFVLSSDFEGLPNALMEAMAMGFPVVCTDCPCGGPKMLINQNDNGILVPVGDSAALAKAICSYIDSPLLKEHCANNAHISMKAYQSDIILNEWDNFLADIHSL